MTLSPNHLLLDASAVSALWDQGQNSEFSGFLERLREKGVGVWCYAGEYSDLLSRSEVLIEGVVSSERLSEPSARQKLEQALSGIQWLSALGSDLEGKDDSDPTAVALARAATRLGSEARVVTADQSRLERGTPFTSIHDIKSIQTNSQVAFIDLGAQQNRIRADLEAGIHRVLHHGRYVMGEEISELESELEKMSGAAHCVCVSSGTDALLAALMAIEIKAGDEVITSPFTFFATAEAIVLLGGVPVYVDIDPETFNLDPGGIEAAVSSRTRAIIPVSLYGQCAEMQDINTIAQRYSLSVIEDAAQSFGASFHGRRSCALSDLACTSFFPAKPLGAYGDGGACFTQDASMADRLRQIRDHGQEGRYHHTTLGINGRLDTIQAVVLIAKLKIFSGEIVARQKVADRYADLLADLEDSGCLTLPVVRPHNTSAWALYTIRVANRDGIQRRLSEQGIPTAVHYPAPLYDQPALKQSGQNCPESDRAAKEVLSLPMHPYLDETAQVRVAQALHEALGSYASTPS